MRFSVLKYSLAFILPVTVAISFTHYGLLSYLPLLYAFGLIPLLELFFNPDNRNADELSKASMLKDSNYDKLLYLVVPVQLCFLVWFIFSIQETVFLSITFFGRSVSMGLMCGILGINVAHELGHRKEKPARLAAKLLLLTSLYQHFYIEHNFGHHKHVSTPNDPASSRYNEWLYAFWFRSVIGSYLSAWRIQLQLLQRKKKSFFSVHNDMLWYTLFSLTLVAVIFISAGYMALTGFIISALIGILLLETVNYIEHYGLSRKKVSERRYETTAPQHSWNSNHVIGRLVLFELSRHSDHHAHPFKPYQVLESYKHSPQMPTGYPGMMLLSALPPFWFMVMNKRVQAALG